MLSNKLTGRYLKTARDILARQPWARGQWFATEVDEAGYATGTTFRAIDTETGYMTVDGKTIPFTKTTAVCAMGAVEAALIQDKNLRPGLRSELYREIERLLDAATARVTAEEVYMSDVEYDYKAYVEDHKRGIYQDQPLLTFDEFFDKYRDDYCEAGYYSVIEYNDDGASSKDDVLNVFDTALSDLRPGPASLALSA